jgi:hypothetical protein
MFFSFGLLNLLHRKSVTFKDNKELGVEYELLGTETRAADHYRQAQFVNKRPKKDRIGGPQGSPFRSFRPNLKSECDPDPIRKIKIYSGSRRSTIQSVRNLLIVKQNAAQVSCLWPDGEAVAKGLGRQTYPDIPIGMNYMSWHELV